jgi:hypothetical protein
MSVIDVQGVNTFVWDTVFLLESSQKETISEGNIKACIGEIGCELESN